MVLQPATNAAGAADDRVTALARAKLAEFQRLKGIENPMTLEDAKASHHKLYKSLLAEAAAEVEGSKENVHPNTPMRPPPPASAPSPAPAPRRNLPAPRRQEPAAKKKPTPPDQDDELELTGAELVALSEAADVLDAATSTASAIQRKAEEILGLNHRSKLLEEALALSWPAPAADVSATRGVSPQGAPPTSPSTVTIHTLYL